MANSFAYLVLVSWPLVTLMLFRRLPLPQALCWSVVVGYLLLPGRAGWNFPMIPTIDKTLIVGVSAAIMCAIWARQDRLAAALPGRTAPPLQLAAPGRIGRGSLASLGHTQGGPRPMQAAPAPRLRGRWLIWGLLALMILSPFATVFANQEPLRWGPRVLTAMAPYDALSLIAGVLVAVLPFLLAMTFLRTHERHVILLRVLAIAGAFYAALALFEVRMSPQLSVWVYGYFPHSWLQHVRGGFRPVVFLHHGLWLGVFLATATLAACVLWRQAIADRLAPRPWLFTTLWLAAVLLLSRNLGATVLMLALAPVIVFTGLRTQAIVAGAIAATVLGYPMLRSAGLVPTDRILSGFAMIDAERAESLQFRVINEDRMLAHAAAKPLTGWGTWGRNRVYDERGRDISVTDGAWIIVMGSFGWLGYIARFGLLTLPIILLALRRREALTPATTGLMVIAALGLVDLLPNATLTPLTWLIGGAIAGRYMLVADPTAEGAPRQQAMMPQAGLAGGIVGPRGPVPAMAAAGMAAAGLAGGRLNGAMMNGAGDGMHGGMAMAGAAPFGAAPPRHQRRPRG